MSGNGPDEIDSRCVLEKRWKEYSVRTIDAMAKIDAIHRNIGTMQTHTEHLSKLGSIANSLEKLDRNLVGPATGRKQIPLVSHLLTLAILGAALLLVMLEKTDKTIDITPTGISIKETGPGVK